MSSERSSQSSKSSASPARKLCSLCGEPIAPARLDALPGVTTCIACAKKHPRKVDTSGIELSQASPINRNGFAPYD
jgi:RNA polymerase-binding transcription factor DksA